MNVTIIGAGYVGLVTAACLAELGNTVLNVDHDHERITLLQAGQCPIYEPGLEEMIRRNQSAGRLAFTTNLPHGIAHGNIIFIAVSTPPLENGAVDLQYVLSVAKQIGQHMHDFKVVVNKSTVPVGTSAHVAQIIRTELLERKIPLTKFSVISNPEFLKEGSAIKDFMQPDRIVIGESSNECGKQARQLMDMLYAPFNLHHTCTLWMDVTSAELTKHAANAMLATRISFINEIANLADKVGADIDAVRMGIGTDKRIGSRYLDAGTGYGGSCLSKDTRSLIHTAAKHNLQMHVIQAVEQVNHAQKHLLVQRVVQYFGPQLHNCSFAMWGLAFKPDTDDLREAPSKTVLCELLRRGAHIAVYDPVAMQKTRHTIAHDLGTSIQSLVNITWAHDPLQALNGVDALLIMTEWNCFRAPDFHNMHTRMRTPLILDGRNLYDPVQMQEAGFIYQGIGRRNAFVENWKAHE